MVFVFRGKMNIFLCIIKIQEVYFYITPMNKGKNLDSSCPCLLSSTSCSLQAVPVSQLSLHQNTKDSFAGNSYRPNQACALSVTQLRSLVLLCSIHFIYICFPGSSSCRSKLVPSSICSINTEADTDSNMTHQPSCPMSPHRNSHSSLRTIASVYLCSLYPFGGSSFSCHWPCPSTDPHPQPFFINRCPAEHSSHTICYI